MESRELRRAGARDEVRGLTWELSWPRASAGQLERGVRRHGSIGEAHVFAETTACQQRGRGPSDCAQPGADAVADVCL